MFSAYQQNDLAEIKLWGIVVLPECNCIRRQETGLLSSFLDRDVTFGYLVVLVSGCVSIDTTFVHHFMFTCVVVHF